MWLQNAYKRMLKSMGGGGESGFAASVLMSSLCIFRATQLAGS